MRPRNIGALAALMVMLAAASHLRAQTPPSANAAQSGATSSSSQADDLYRRANVAYDQGRLEEAYELYSQAFALKKSYDIASNLGQTEFKLGKFAAAAEHLAYSLSVYPPNGKVEARDKMQAMLEDARKQSGRLRVEVNVEGALVLIDGKEIGRSPLASEVYVSAGSHQIEARKDGFKLVTRSVTVQAGQSESAELTLEKADSSVVDPPPGEPKPIWPYIVLGGVGAIGIGLGVGLHVASASRAADAEGFSCPGDESTCPAAATDAVSSANAMLGGAIAGYSLAGLGIAGLIAYVAWSDPTAETETSVRVLPVIEPERAGLHMTVSF